MKRDMKLVRGILLKLEEDSPYYSHLQFLIEGYTQEEINYHIGIMYEAKLLSIFDKPIKSIDSPTKYLPKSLTWQGHDFLDNIRNEKI